MPYAKCLNPTQAEQALRTLHEGIGGGHYEGRALSRSLVRVGLFWPGMHKDAMKFAKKCDQCQRHGNFIKQSPEELHMMLSTWPFAQWGLDIVGPLPMASGQRQYLIIATDYFSKWVESEALVRITEEEIRKFVWINIICRYGIPNALVVDNGSQFIAEEFRGFCTKYGIDLRFASVEYPQANGQAESTNKTIQNGIRRRLHGKKGGGLTNYIMFYGLIEQPIKML